MTRKVVVAHTFAEGSELSRLNEQYRREKKYWKIVDVKSPNYVMLPMGVSRVDKCPKCGSSKIQEIRCITCGFANVKCLDCPAYWQMGLPKEGSP